MSSAVLNRSNSAAEKLRDLLSQLDHGSSPPSPVRLGSSPKAVRDNPKGNELHLLVQATEQINRRLKDENDALNDENVKLRSNVTTLIEENNRLHEQIRTTFVSDMLRLINLDEGQSVLNDKESHIADMYTKKMRHLEVELKDAKERLNIYENAWQGNELNQCLKCGSPIPQAQNLIENNERYINLIAENEANKRKSQQLQKKWEESEAKEQAHWQKLQQYMQLFEESQFEKNEATVERDQLKVELTETQKRLNKFLEEMNEKIQQEKQKLEKFFEEQMKETSTKLKQFEERSAQYELTIDRLAREKTSLASDLDEWKARIHRQEVDLSEASDTVKLQIQKAMRERDQANANTMQIRSDFEKLLLQSNQDALQLRQQVGSTQTRLHEVENELLSSKKQCLELHEQVNHLTRENLMLKSVKQSLERSREENIESITVILNKREQDFRATIENLEIERQQSLSYLEDLVNSQNTVLNKLRLYARQLTSEIETVLEQKNEIVQEMTVENQELRTKLSSAYERLEQTDTQLLQHNETHIKLKQRVIDLNNRVKEYETIINKIRTQDLIEYQQRAALASQRS